MDSDLRILSFNCGGLSVTKHRELKLFMELNKLDVLCLQETKCSANNFKTIPGYNIEYINHTNNKDNVAGGLAIYVAQNVQYYKLNIDVPLKSDGSAAVETLAIVVHPSKHAPFVLVITFTLAVVPCSFKHTREKSEEQNRAQTVCLYRRF